MSFRIFYGINDNRKDVTEICLNNLIHNNIITIPKSDTKRAHFFGDHLFGTVKKIFILINNTEFEYNKNYTVKININKYTINDSYNDIEINNKLDKIHKKLQINYGNFKQELPEQKMAARFLTGNEKVLEIGGNIGRNALVIASIINNNNFVTLETDSDIAKKLEENRNLNNYTFHIENSALSKCKLIQKGWDSKPSNILKKGYKWVNTISLKELNDKYKINFDTLIIDCEGAFYYILMDMPEILTNIKLIIMENDYKDIFHKNYVDSVLKEHNFCRVYQEAGGWGCCREMFFEVWTKIHIVQSKT